MGCLMPIKETANAISSIRRAARRVSGVGSDASVVFLPPHYRISLDNLCRSCQKTLSRKKSGFGRDVFAPGSAPTLIRVSSETGNDREEKEAPMCHLSKHSISLLTVVFLIAVTSSADAGLIGTKVVGHAGIFQFCPQCNVWNVSNLDPTPVSATVGPGVEFSVPRENPDRLGLRLDADFTNTTLILNLGNASNQSVFFVDFDLFFTHLNGITDVNVLSNEFSGSSFSFPDDSITVHLPGGTFPNGERKTLLLGITTVPDGGTSALFLGLSLAALWTLRRGFATVLT